MSCPFLLIQLAILANTTLGAAAAAALPTPNATGPASRYRIPPEALQVLWHVIKNVIFWLGAFALLVVGITMVTTVAALLVVGLDRLYPSWLIWKAKRAAAEEDRNGDTSEEDSGSSYDDESSGNRTRRRQPLPIPGWY